MIKYYLARITITNIKSFFCGLIAYLWVKLIPDEDLQIIVFGTGDGYEHNNVGLVYNFLKTNARNKEAIWISSIDDHDNKTKKLRKGSIKSYLACFRAETLIFDSRNSDVCPGFLRFCSGKKILINHGFDFLKDIGPSYYSGISADVIIASSEFEKKVKVERFGLEENKAVVATYPRFYAPNINRKSSSTLTALVFPTWSPCQEIYETKIECIHKQLSALDPLIAEKTDLIFIKHKMMSNRQASSIEKKFPNSKYYSDLKSHILESTLLITDHSSICWDFFASNRPVFFIPDGNHLIRNRIINLQQEGLFNYNPTSLHSVLSAAHGQTQQLYQNDILAKIIGDTKNKSTASFVEEVLNIKC